MNPAEKKAYESLMNVPHKKKIAAASKRSMHRVAEAHLKAQKVAWAERKARLKPVHQAMRLAAQKSPEWAGVREAISALSKKKLPAHKRPKPARLPAPKSPYLKLGSAHVVLPPPYTSALSGQSLDGSGSSVVGLTADSSKGNMAFELTGGTDAQGNGGSGSASCWAAVGEVLTTSSEGILTFSATPSLSWSATWLSSFWREAAGNIWIGQVIERFDPDGSYIDSPIVTQNILGSFDDYNFLDGGNLSSSKAGDQFQMQANLYLESDLVYNCWIWIGGSAKGDSSGIQISSTDLGMVVNVSSLTFDLI